MILSFVVIFFLQEKAVEATKQEKERIYCRNIELWYSQSCLKNAARIGGCVRIYLPVPAYPAGEKKEKNSRPDIPKAALLSEHPVGNLARCQVPPQKSASLV
jgi:hypothetical protein